MNKSETPVTPSNVAEGQPSAQAITLKRMVEDAERVCVLTGAGISTESGIPDFRSPGGIWSQYRIIEYREFMASETARLEDWRRRFAMEDQLGEVKPNVGHRAVAQWVEQGKCPVLITQNIDGLHQEAGIAQDRLIEIHGNGRRAVCTDCGLMHTIGECRVQVEDEARAPVCRACSGIVKSDVVMFGEMMPVKETEAAFEAAEACDLFIAIGTSLVVQPAAGLPIAAMRRGAKLAIISRQPTELDRYADLAIHAGIGETLSLFL